MALKIGIDVGGTFTDFVVTRDDAEPAIFKTLSTPSDPSIAVVNGLTDIAASMNPPLSLEAFAPTIDTIVHGTTVTTNATLTGTGAKMGPMAPVTLPRWMCVGVCGVMPHLIR